MAVLAVLGVDGLMCRFSNVLFLFCCNSYTVAQIQAQVANGTSLYHAALQRSPYNEIVPSNRDLNNRLSHSGKRTIEAMSEEVRVSLLFCFIFFFLLLLLLLLLCVGNYFALALLFWESYSHRQTFFCVLSSCLGKTTFVKFSSKGGRRCGGPSFLPPPPS